MVLPRDYRESFCFEDVDVLLSDVKDNHLISAFSHLSFVAPHETATERINFILVWY
jgi:hypothetical protein